MLYEEGDQGDGGGHVVVAKCVHDTGMVEIYEPIHPRPNPHLIPIERVVESLKGMGPIGFVIIKDNPDHQD